MKNVSLKLFPVLISLVFLFPILKESLSTLSVILLFLNTIIYGISSRDFASIKSRTMLLTIPFWIVLIFSIDSENFKISLTHIQHSLFFLVMPITFAMIPVEMFTKKKINLYISVLKNICIVVSIVYVSSFLLNVPYWKFNVVFQHVSSFRNYIYYDFKLFIIHPTYFTSLLILCTAHSFDLFLRNRKRLQLIYVIIFISITILLLTRLNLVFLILLLSMMIFNRGLYKIKIKFIFALSLTTLILTFLFFTPGIKDRFVEIYESFSVKPKDIAYDSTNVRKAIFDSSIKIAEEKWMLGVGFENLQNKLNLTYKENYDSSFYAHHNYMTHNYYFYVFLSSGIIGLFSYFFYIINIIKICLKTDMFLFKIFLLNALIICLIEDYFYRQFGALYFNLLLMCFIRFSENTATDKDLIE